MTRKFNMVAYQLRHLFRSLFILIAVGFSNQHY